MGGDSKVCGHLHLPMFREHMEVPWFPHLVPPGPPELSPAGLDQLELVGVGQELIRHPEGLAHGVQRLHDGPGGRAHVDRDVLPQGGYHTHMVHVGVGQEHPANSPFLFSGTTHLPQEVLPVQAIDVRQEPQGDLVPHEAVAPGLAELRIELGHRTEGGPEVQQDATMLAPYLDLVTAYLVDPAVDDDTDQDSTPDHRTNPVG